MAAGGTVGRHAGEAGMTLVEMLVVLAIVGIAAGAVALSVGGPVRTASVEGEARRLAARIRIAADGAMLDDAAIALAADTGGYGFVEQDPASGRWQPREDDILGRHDLPDGIRLDPGTAGTAPVAIGIDGGDAGMAIGVTRGDRRWTVRWDGLNAVATAAGGA